MPAVSFEMRVPARGSKQRDRVNPEKSVPTEYVYIEVEPGQVICRKATDADRAEYPEAYAAFTVGKV